MERTKYRKLRAQLKRELERQSGERFTSVSPTFIATISGFKVQEVEAVWPTLVKEFNLVDDGTGYNSWAPKGKGITPERLEALRKGVG